MYELTYNTNYFLHVDFGCRIMYDTFEYDLNRLPYQVNIHEPRYITRYTYTTAVSHAFPFNGL